MTDQIQKALNIIKGCMNEFPKTGAFTLPDKFIKARKYLWITIGQEETTKLIEGLSTNDSKT